MTDDSPGGLRVVRADVYYDPDSGAILHVHRIAVPVGETLDEERIAVEVGAFEDALAAQHGQALPRLEVDEDAMRAAIPPDVALRVDTTQRRLVPET